MRESFRLSVRYASAVAVGVPFAFLWALRAAHGPSSPAELLSFLAPAGLLSLAVWNWDAVRREVNEKVVYPDWAFLLPRRIRRPNSELGLLNLLQSVQGTARTGALSLDDDHDVIEEVAREISQYFSAAPDRRVTVSIAGMEGSGKSSFLVAWPPNDATLELIRPQCEILPSSSGAKYFFSNDFAAGRYEVKLLPRKSVLSKELIRSLLVVRIESQYSPHKFGILCLSSSRAGAFDPKTAPTLADLLGKSLSPLIDKELTTHSSD